MNLDLVRARGETPGCENVVHFNNAGASLMPSPVLDTVTSYLQLEAQTGGYEAAKLKAAEVEKVYDSVATLLNAGRDEIALVENATRAWDMAFYSIPFGPGDRILTAMAEYASNYVAFLQLARKTGATIEIIPDDEYGQLSVEALSDMLDERVKLIAITHVPTNGGLVNPAVEVGKLAREAKILYLLDACQSTGQMPLDVKEIGCDFLSATGRKYLRGPRGTGFLYARREVLEKVEPPFVDLHAVTWVAQDRYELRADARRFENWERSIANMLGLGAAVDYALEWGLPDIRERVTALAETLRTQLSDVPGVRVRDQGKERCGIVTFTVEGKDPDDLQAALAEKRVNVTVSRLTSTRLDMEARGLTALVRASVHYYNSEEELSRFCSILQSLI
ncbi:MAG TPA: aminotransferase class V-fold PLP-dependent enzyme [Chloroflexia bacterium]|nr:aminotransferase class V-fold PLP-dependent enzyme [Chloroflexia bacterium]